MSKHILFMGTPEFASPTLESLIQSNNNDNISVITMPDKVRGRGSKTSPSPIKKLAQDNQLTIHQPESKIQLTHQINELNPDLIIVVAYGMIIEKSIVDKYLCINCHASLLPKYRGASPIQAALLNGDHATGITIIRLNEKMDAGDICSTTEMPIDPTDNYGSLSHKLAELGANEIMGFINTQWKPNTLTCTPQNHSNATYCKKIEKQDLLIDQSTPKQTIIRKINAFSPKPGAYCIHNNKRIKLLAAKLSNNALSLITIQPEGKPPMPYKDYLFGNNEGLPYHDE